MQFNSEKFECLRLRPGNTAIPEFDYLGPDDQPIQVKPSLRDLVVHLSTDLSFKVQVEKVVAAASRVTNEKCAKSPKLNN